MSDSNYLDWDTYTRMELIYAFLGQKLDAGAFREVWTCELDPSLVVKIAKDTDDKPCFDNVIEWRVWQEVKHDEDIAPWFAPCVAISPGGRVLVMRRTTSVTAAELESALPKVPRFFHDVAPRNWGRIGDQYCCHDYAFNIVDDEYTNPRLWQLKRQRWLDE